MAINPDLSKFKLQLSSKELASKKMVKVDGMPFSNAVSVMTNKRPKKQHSVQLNTLNTLTFNPEDNGVLTFYARATSLPEGKSEAMMRVLYERNSPPWKKSVYKIVKMGKAWKKYSFPFIVAREFGDLHKGKYLPGEMKLGFNLGFDPQTVEIADVRVMRLVGKFSLYDFGENTRTYPGRELNAKWRVDAMKRIENIRKGNLELAVLSADGKPVKDAKVSYKLKKHKFYFGTCVNSYYFKRYEGTEDGDKYRENIKKLFNMAVLEAGMKWPEWEEHKERVLYTTDWLTGNGLALRGHCLFWPSWRRLPKDFREKKDDKSYLRKRCDEHIKDMVSAYKGKVVQYDVVNEVESNNDLLKILGDDIMVDWWNKTHNLDPSVGLYINDYGIMTDDREHQDKYEKRIQSLVDKGAKISGIGMQSHFYSDFPSPQRVLEILERFGKFNLPIMITEYDHYIFDEKCQGDYMRDFLIAIFSHPRVEGFMMWGFWDGKHWRKNAPIFHKDWTLKESGKAYIDLVFNKWATRGRAVTNAKGNTQFTGFYGDYEVTVESGGKSKKFTVPFNKTGEKTTLKL